MMMLNNVKYNLQTGRIDSGFKSCFSGKDWGSFAKSVRNTCLKCPWFFTLCTKNTKKNAEKAVYIPEDSKKNICSFFQSKKKMDFFVGAMELDLLRANYKVSIVDHELFSHSVESSLCESEAHTQKENTIGVLKQILSKDQYSLLSKLACQNLVTFLINNKGFENKLLEDGCFFLPDLSSAEAAGRFISSSQKFVINILEDKTVNVECSFNSRDADIEYMKSIADLLELDDITGLDVKISLNIDTNAKVRINDFYLVVYDLLRR